MATNLGLEQYGLAGVLLIVQIGFWLRAEKRQDRQIQALHRSNQQLVTALLDALSNSTKAMERLASSPAIQQHAKPKTLKPSGSDES